MNSYVQPLPKKCPLSPVFFVRSQSLAFVHARAMTAVHRDRLVLASFLQRYSLLNLKVKSFPLTFRNGRTTIMNLLIAEYNDKLSWPWSVHSHTTGKPVTRISIIISLIITLLAIIAI